MEERGRRGRRNTEHRGRRLRESRERRHRKVPCKLFPRGVCAGWRVTLERLAMSLEALTAE